MANISDVEFTKRLEKLAAQAMHELDVIGVGYNKPYEWKLSRATSTWGVCHRRRNAVTGKYEYSIRISRMTLDNRVTDEKAKETIIHELIHTIQGCWGHGTSFKRMAELVNDCYACYNVTRVSSAAEMGISREVVEEYKPQRDQAKYVVCCCHCRSRFVYHKMTNLVCQLILANGATETSYTCPCGSKRFVLMR